MGGFTLGSGFGLTFDGWIWAYSQRLDLGSLLTVRFGLIPGWVNVPARCSDDKVRISLLR